MLKKIFAATALMFAMGVSMASTAPYIGASVGVVNNSTDSGSVKGQAGVFRGMPFSVFAGYAGLNDQGLYLAGELNGTVGTGEFSNANGLKTTYGYGVSLVPGLMLNQHTLAFARAGVVRARFSSVGSTATGGQFGLGLQTSLTQNLDVRGEYDFTAFQSVSTVGAPRQDAFNVGLVYKFL